MQNSLSAKLGVIRHTPSDALWPVTLDDASKQIKTRAACGNPARSAFLPQHPPEPAGVSMKSSPSKSARPRARKQDCPSVGRKDAGRSGRVRNAADASEFGQNKLVVRGARREPGPLRHSNHQEQSFEFVRVLINYELGCLECQNLHLGEKDRDPMQL